MKCRSGEPTPRTYYLTWQACSLAFTVFVGAGLYFGLRIADGAPDFTSGVIIGIVMASTWHEMKWKDGD